MKKLFAIYSPSIALASLLAIGTLSAVVAQEPQQEIRISQVTQESVEGPAPLAAAGQIAYYEKEFAAAVAHLTEAISESPRDAVSYFYRGSAQNELKNHEAAFADFSRALALQPDFAEALFARAGTSARMGDVDLAIADYEQVIASGAMFKHRAHDQLAKIYLERGDFNAALEHANASIHQIGTYAEAWELKAQALSGLGADELAREARIEANEVRELRGN